MTHRSELVLTGAVVRNFLDWRSFGQVFFEFGQMGNLFSRVD